MSEERIRILKLVAEGKATPEEAERLFDAVGKDAPVPAPRKAPRFLRVTVDSSDGDKVNIRVPLALVRAGMKFGALVPREAREQMEEKGIDLSALSSMDTEELIEALQELEVNVDSHDGDIVKVFCE